MPTCQPFISIASISLQGIRPQLALDVILATLLVC